MNTALEESFHHNTKLQFFALTETRWFFPLNFCAICAEQPLTDLTGEWAAYWAEWGANQGSAADIQIQSITHVIPGFKLSQLICARDISCCCGLFPNANLFMYIFQTGFYWFPTQTLTWLCVRGLHTCTFMFSEGYGHLAGSIPHPYFSVSEKVRQGLRSAESNLWFFGLGPLAKNLNSGLQRAHLPNLFRFIFSSAWFYTHLNSQVKPWTQETV